MTDPRNFAALRSEDILADSLVALASRLEILVFWREMDRTIYAEVCEFFARQFVEVQRFTQLGQYLLEEAIGHERTATRLLLLASLVEPKRATELRQEALLAPESSAFQQFSEFQEETKNIDWESLTRGERMALLERFREIRTLGDDET